MDEERAPFVIVVPCFYWSADDPRARLALRFCEACAEYDIPLIVADDSPPEAGVAELFRERNAIVLEGCGDTFGGGKGGGIRAAIAHAVESVVDPEGVILYSEPEKVRIPDLAAQIIAKFVAGSADIVVPKRADLLFRRSYPLEQYHSESFGNRYLENFIRSFEESRLPIAPGLDWFFGPFAFHASLAHHWLAYDGVLWDAQLVPLIRAASCGEAKVLSVVVDYDHAVQQFEQEEGTFSFAAKRFDQLNALLPLVRSELEAAMDAFAAAEKA